MSVIYIDGSQGEGGGQILRTALSLSMMTGKPFILDHIRAGRSKPGLLRQHLTCVQAAAEISSAQVEGAELQSETLTFRPGGVTPGDYQFSIGSAGSCSLVLQTVLLPLAWTGSPSGVVVEGGTHNSGSPSFDTLRDEFGSVLSDVGVEARFHLERYGFYPAGGGRISATIGRAPTGVGPVDYGGKVVRQVEAVALSSGIPDRIGKAEVELIARELNLPVERIEAKKVDSPGPGNVVLVKVLHDDAVTVFTSFGARGLPWEKVAEDAIRQTRRYLRCPGSVSEHLQDQVLLPLAVAGGGRFRTVEPTDHTRTNAEVIRRFLPVSITMEPQGPDDWIITVRKDQHADF